MLGHGDIKTFSGDFFQAAADKNKCEEREPPTTIAWKEDLKSASAFLIWH